MELSTYVFVVNRVNAQDHRIVAEHMHIRGNALVYRFLILLGAACQLAFTFTLLLLPRLFELDGIIGGVDNCGLGYFL